jgi:hypothetical protein
MRPPSARSKAHDKVVEINAHSFKSFERCSAENCRAIARLLKKYEVPVCRLHDAHFATFVGSSRHRLRFSGTRTFRRNWSSTPTPGLFARWVSEKSGCRAFDL